ncbi:MAG: ABC-2 transporter permease [Pseudomonadota bacterium]
MASSQNFRFAALLQREFREYRTSLFWTPLVTALLLAILMLGSVILANRISFIGDAVLESILAGNSVNLSITVNEAGERVEELTVTERASDFAPPDAPPPPSYDVIDEGPTSEEQWNFSREWSFEPQGDDDGTGPDQEDVSFEGRELNVMLATVHGILLLVLFVTTFNYLVSCLFDDRKDRSILFWRSLPVTEWEIVASKFVMALIVAPLMFIAVSIVLQLVYVLLLMALVWRMGEDAYATVLTNIDFGAVLLDPVSGWLMTALLVAPAYAWLLLASSLAVRSPLWLAIVPPLGLLIVERLFFGSSVIGNAILRHIPNLSDETQVGFYMFGPAWTGLDLSSVAAGLVFAGVCLTGAVWLRTHRWELN